MSRASVATILMSACIAAASICIANDASACACCGVPDTWSSQTGATDSYAWQVLENTPLGPGNLRDEHCYECDDTVDWSVDSIEHQGSTWRFRAGEAEFVFSASGTVEHRMVDMQVQTPSDDTIPSMTPIYHELIVSGILRLPAEALGFVRRDTPATVVLRGISGMCLESSALKRWLLKAEDENRRLVGSGEILDGLPATSGNAPNVP